MKKQKKKRGLFAGIMMFMIAGLFVRTEQAEAASASVTFSTNVESVSVGEELSVELNVDTDSLIGSIEGYVDYDSSMLEYLVGADGISGGNGTLKVSDTVIEEDAVSKSYQITFRAKKKGNSMIQFSEQPVVYEADTEEAMSISYEDISIKITKAKILSNNAKLDALQVSPGTLEPSFAKNIREYKVFVGANTDRITVSALASDADASVSVRGNENLLEGENLVIVTVEAPSGKQKKYKIYVQKESAEPEKSEEEPEEESEKEEDEKEEQKEEASTDSFKVVEKNGSTIIKNKISYTLVPLEDSALIPGGYVKTKLILYGVSVTAYTLEEDLENDFILMYAKKGDGEPQFYQYDRREKTIQRFQQHADETKVVVGGGKEALSANEYNEKVQKLSIVVGVSAALAVLFALGMLGFAIKYYSSKAGKMDDIYR